MKKESKKKVLKEEKSVRGENLSLAQLCKRLERAPGFIRNIQIKLKLHIPSNSDGHSPAYTAFLRTIIYLRIFSVPMEDVIRLFEVEKKLLVLLKLDSLTDSKTWYLDACGKGDPCDNRLMLTNIDIGNAVTSEGVQIHLDFASRERELFSSREMGEDVRRVLNRYVGQKDRIICLIKKEWAMIDDSIQWAGRFELMAAGK